MSSEESKGIWIITGETPSAEEVKGGKDAWDDGATYGEYPTETRSGKKRTWVNAEDLKQEMAEFLNVMEAILDQAQKPKSKIRLDEIELSVEINGEGQISIWGTGGKVGGKGAINLKFKRIESE